MTLQPGTTLGRYQILEPLGTGGMATVYKAYEPSLDRVVALKIIRPGLAGEADFVARFRREAQAVARLTHPNIVQVHSFDEVDGRLFLAMQYLDGGTLKDRIAALAPGARLDRDEVASIVTQVADALAYAHEQGVVHRDIKPSNIMLTAHGAIVTDFGIAKIVAADQLTQTGVGVGTPEYMAPEQGAGRPVDHRADIYSLGIVAYELLVGRVPFIADTPFAVVAAHLRDPLPLPSRIDPTVPPATERALLKALAKDPAQRFASATELAAALRESLGGGTAVPTVVPRARPSMTRASRPGPRASLLAAGAAIMLLLGGGTVVSRRLDRTATAPATEVGSPAPNPQATVPPILPPLTAPPGPATTTPLPTAAPPHAVPAKGALLWQAKLDGTSSDISSWTVSRGSAANTEIRYLPGAIEIATVATDSEGDAALNMPTRQTYVGELDLAGATALREGVAFQWTLRGCTPTNNVSSGFLALQVMLGEEVMQLTDDLGPNRGRQELTPLIAIPGLKSGATHTIAAVIAPARATLYLDEKLVADVPYTRCTSPGRASISLYTYGTGGPAVVRITGARFYALPS